MNEFELFVEKLKGRFPDAEMHIEAPDKPKGNYWLDIRNGQKLVTLEWRPEQGFGFYAEDAGYGEGPEAIIPEGDNALERLAAFFQAEIT